jgi:hypothetical protein
MIDWILAEKIAAYVAGAGDGRVPTSDLVDCDRSVLCPSRKASGGVSG